MVDLLDFLPLPGRRFGASDDALADAELPVRLHPGKVGLGVDQLGDRLFFLLPVPHHELSQTALLTEQFEVESLHSTYQLQLVLFEVLSNLVASIAEVFYQSYDFIDDCFGEGLNLPLNEFAWIFLANRNKKVDCLETYCQIFNHYVF